MRKLLMIFGMAFTSASQASGWEFMVGGVYAQSDSTVTGRVLNGTEEIDVDFERDLSLTDSSFLPQISVGYEFNDRHHVNLSYFRVHREGTNDSISQPFEIELDDGIYQVQAGISLTTRFNYDIYRLTYGYDFYQSEALTLTLNAGLHVIPVELAFEGQLGACVNSNCSSLEQRTVSQTITAPLPNGGFKAEWKFMPDWYLSGQTQLFYLEFDDFTGSLLDLSGQVSYAINPSWRVGLGYGIYLISVSKDLQRGELEVDVLYRGSTAQLEYRF